MNDKTISARNIKAIPHYHSINNTYTHRNTVYVKGSKDKQGRYCGLALLVAFIYSKKEYLLNIFYHNILIIET